MMKFGKRAAAFAAAIVLMLGAGATASNAAPDNGFRAEIVVSGANNAGDPLWTSGFNVVPTDNGFDVHLEVTRLPWKSHVLHLGVYPIDQVFDSSMLQTGPPSLVAGVPSAEQAMLEFNEKLSGPGYLQSIPLDATIDFPVTGPYAVMVFSESAGEVRLVGHARVHASEAQVLEPSYDGATSTLTIPDTAGQYRYVDAMGAEWLAGVYPLEESLTLRAEADLSRGFVLPAGTWEWTYTVDDTTPVVTPPVTPPVPPVAGPGTPGTTTGTAPGEDRLLPEFEGKVGAPATAVPGGQVAILVGTQYAGKEIDVYVYSDPVFLGRHVVAADGTVTVSLPNGLIGEHRLAVYSGGELIGWNRIVIDNPSGTDFVAGSMTAGQLPQTGADSNSAGLLTSGALIVASLGFLIRRRPQHSRGL